MSDRPRVTLKLATSLDGRIATASGESRWITGEEARAATHALRADHDAVLIGIETALADDPELTVRLPGYEGRQPVRVVLDSRQRLGLSSTLVTRAATAPTIVATIAPPRVELTAAGVTVLTVAAKDGRVDVAAALGALHSRGIGSVLVEGGGQVAASFIAAGCVDSVEWFRAPIVLGAEGRPCIGPLGLASLSTAPRFRRVAIESSGDDLWERYAKV